MTKMIASRVLILASVFLAWATLSHLRVVAQDFEVASIKVNKSGRYQSSIGRVGGRIIFENVPLRECIAYAYGIGVDQDYAITGPEWFKAARYDIVATVPVDIPKDQVLLMIRALLGERFKLRIHHERKELRVCALIVAVEVRN